MDNDTSITNERACALILGTGPIVRVIRVLPGHEPTVEEIDVTDLDPPVEVDGPF